MPKNVRHYGNDNGKRKIYIEDYVYSFIEGLRQDEYDEGMTGLLLGEIRKEKDAVYVFVKGAVEVTNAAVFKDKIAFTDETWPIANSVVGRFFGDMQIVGWYLNSTTITDKHMDIINKADKDSFSDEDKIFILMNPDNGNEAVYEKSKSGLKKVSGYTVFFERNESMQNYMTEIRGEHMSNRADSDEETGRYRQMVNNRGSVSKKVKTNLSLIYGLSMLLIIVVLVIGINSINGYNKMKDKAPEATGGEILDNSDGPSKTPVEDVEGDITTEAPTDEEPTTETPTTEAPTTEAPTTEAPTTEAPTTEAPTEDPYTYYVVKAGDSLFKICQQVYGVQSNAYVEKIKAANQDVNFGELLPGVQLRIPKI